MSAPAKFQRTTPGEFNQWEQTQEDRYELVDGVPRLEFVEWDGPRTMVGATKGRNWIVRNVLRSPGNQLREMHGLEIGVQLGTIHRF